MDDIKCEIKNRIANIDVSTFNYQDYDELTLTKGFGEEEFKLLEQKLGKEKFSQLIKDSDESFFKSITIKDIDKKIKEIHRTKK